MICIFYVIRDASGLHSKSLSNLLPRKNLYRTDLLLFMDRRNGKIAEDICHCTCQIKLQITQVSA